MLKNKNNCKIFFCLFLLSAFFVAEKGHAVDSSGFENSDESTRRSIESDESVAELYDFLPAWEDVKDSVTGAWNALPSVKDSAKWVKENTWNRLPSMDPVKDSVTGAWNALPSVKDSAEWMKENTWNRLPPMDPVKEHAESALNTLTSGVGSAWGYLFGKNNAHVDNAHVEVPHDTMVLSDEDKAFLAEKVLKMRDQRAGRMSTVEKKDLVNRVKEIANRLGVHPHNINEKTKIGALRNFVKNHLDR